LLDDKFFQPLNASEVVEILEAKAIAFLAIIFLNYENDFALDFALV